MNSGCHKKKYTNKYETNKGSMENRENLQTQYCGKQVQIDVFKLRKFQEHAAMNFYMIHWVLR